MRLLRLLLSDYRNFSRLDLSLPAGPCILVGDNAQGKTNLLEAIYLLATMRNPRAQTEGQLIRRQTLSNAKEAPDQSGQGLVQPCARAVAEVETQRGTLKVEVAVVSREGSDGGAQAGKLVRVNGLPRRLMDAVGQLNAVLFSADDLDLVKGPPALKRRYLDLTIAQVDNSYLGARQRYGKVVLQRNHLLKRIRERLARPDELAFWDQELVREGTYITWARARAVLALGELAAAAHAHLAPGEELRLLYQPRLSPEGEPSSLVGAEPEAIREELLAAQRRHLQREIAAGMTLVGPHRDDLFFLLDGTTAAAFASRAQQRTIALALRLAEARYLLAQRGDPPVLLLDDVLSEMDAHRRRCVLGALADYQQVLITTTDLDRFSADFLASAALYNVVDGSVSAATGAAVSERTEDA